MKPIKRVIFHIDMDAFFAAIEQRDNPELRGKPVIIGAKPGNRGVASTCSYEARAFGVHSAIPISQAVKLCPNGIFIRPNMEKYSAVSHELMELFDHFSPLVEKISVDEAFLDMSGMEKLLGSPYEIAQSLQKQIKEKLNLTASVGIAPNKFLAKLASDMKKPAGITQTPFEAEEIIAWLASLPVKRIWGVGKETEKKLKLFGVTTVAHLQALDESLLISRFGKAGKQLAQLRYGVDPRSVTPRGGPKSVSNEQTFQKDIHDLDYLNRVLLKLASKVSRRLRRQNLTGRTIHLTWRTPNHQRHSASQTIATPMADTGVIYETTKRLLVERVSSSIGVRLIGLGVGSFEKGDEQINFFSQEEAIQKSTWSTNDSLIDMIEEKVGKRVKRGGEI